MANNKSLQALAESWGKPYVVRDECALFAPGMLNQKTLANLDAEGRGPKGRFRVGRKVVYPVTSLIEFLESRVTEIAPSRPNYEK